MHLVKGMIIVVIVIIVTKMYNFYLTEHHILASLFANDWVRRVGVRKTSCFDDFAVTLSSRLNTEVLFIVTAQMKWAHLANNLSAHSRVW